MNTGLYKGFIWILIDSNMKLDFRFEFKANILNQLLNPGLNHLLSLAC